MFKIVRPVIIVVENTPVVVSEIKEIVKSIKRGCFWEEFEITVDIFEILTDTTDKEPCFVNYKDVSYFPKIVDNKDIKTVDINHLFDYLCKFEFLNKSHLYVQPIVLFALDGSVDYSFCEEKLVKFRESYIYSDSLRPVTFSGFEVREERHERVINAFLNKGGKNEAEPDTFLAFSPYSAFTYAFWLMGTFPKGETDIIIEPPFPTDIVIRNGEIFREKTKSPLKIARWKKELQEYNRFCR